MLAFSATPLAATNKDTVRALFTMSSRAALFLSVRPPMRSLYLADDETG
jgi:hypothetical protein